MSTPEIWATGYGGYAYRVLTCTKHPRYTGKLKPRVPCDGCWWLYFARNDRTPETVR